MHSINHQAARNVEINLIHKQNHFTCLFPLDVFMLHTSLGQGRDTKMQPSSLVIGHKRDGCQEFVINNAKLPKMAVKARLILN